MDVLLKHFADDAEQGNRMIVVCFSFSPDLCIGITLDIFHSWGMTPLEIDMLNNSHRDGAIDVAVFFNINADTPSGPMAFEVSSNRSISSISEGEQKRDSDSDMSKLRELGGEWSGGTDRLKHCEKNEFRVSAFSLSLVVLDPL